jgi:hypothetical protein
MSCCYYDTYSTGSVSVAEVKICVLFSADGIFRIFLSATGAALIEFLRVIPQFRIDSPPTVSSTYKRARNYHREERGASSLLFMVDER